MTYFKVTGGNRAYRKTNGTITPSRNAATGITFGCNTAVPTNISANIDIVTPKKMSYRKTNGGGAVPV